MRRIPVTAKTSKLFRVATMAVATVTMVATLSAAAIPARAATAAKPPNPAPAGTHEHKRSPAPKPAHVKVGPGRSREFLQIKFAEGTDLRLRHGHLVSERSGSAPALDAILRRFPGTTATRLFSLSEHQLAEVQQRRQTASGREQADLNLYFRLRVRSGTDIAALADALNSLPIVESADLAPTPVAPPSTPSYVGKQGYRAASASGGIDADYAQTVPGGRGENVQIVDAEYGWNRSHEDLSRLRAAGSEIRVGTPLNTFTNDHGTAVIGEIAGDQNTYGVTGLAPSASLATVNTNSSEYGWNIANAIITATQYMHAGDVLLIEQQIAGYANGCGVDQVGCVAVEWNNAIYDAIVSATSAGIIVVEAAGNGQQNLDDAYYGTSFPQGRANSGAIIVGAGNPPGCTTRGAVAARGRLSFSNYGTRVDVQGWGSCVTTTGYGDLQNVANATYAGDFGGTSSASPIVASAAAVLSSVAKQRGTTLTPAEVRSILKSTGNPQAAGETAQIGPLPNLRAAIDSLSAGAAKPVVAALQHYVPKGSVLGSTISVRESWSASDATGIAAYSAWVQTDGGTWTQLTLPTATTTSMTYSLTPGHSYSFAVAAKNGAGVWGNYTYDKAFTPSVLQENQNVVYSTGALGWTRAAWSSASGGYVDVAAARSATASFTFTARNVAWVGTKATNRGEADIYLDGVYKERVDLYSATTTARTAVRSYYWPTSGKHTIKVVVVGTVNRPKVDVDAFVTT